MNKIKYFLPPFLTDLLKTIRNKTKKKIGCRAEGSIS